jgi:hypothetical protein
MSTYEGEHTIFGLLGQANLTQNDVIVSLNWWKEIEKTDQKQSTVLATYYIIFERFCEMKD